MIDVLPTSWHSYPRIHAIGHRFLSELMSHPVIIEEKVDGSQFSFGVFDGELKCRSKGAVLNITEPEKMFNHAVETAKSLAPVLHPGWTYRCEYLNKPKHNTLAYGRIPANYLIGFDINVGQESYLPHDAKQLEFARIGLESVPVMFAGMVGEPIFRKLLESISVLGLQKIEGVVVKQMTPSLFGPDGKALIGKFVSEDFKEVHTGKERKVRSNDDIVAVLIAKYTSPARWAKSVQHLREAGKITDSPTDIGMCLKEINVDLEAECKAEIQEKLWEWFRKDFLHGVTGGFPAWYKEQLLKKQFEGTELAMVGVLAVAPVARVDL